MPPTNSGAYSVFGAYRIFSPLKAQRLQVPLTGHPLTLAPMTPIAPMGLPLSSYSGCVNSS